MNKQYFEYTDDKSDKFWEITREGKSFTVRYGKKGSTGQVQRKEFASEEIAGKEADKLIREKMKKGYAVKDSGKSASEPKANTDTRSSPKKTLEEAVEQNDTDAVMALFNSLTPKKQKDEAYSYLNAAFMHRNRKMIELFTAAKPDGYIFEFSMDEAIDGDLPDVFKLIFEYLPQNDPEINLNKVLMRAAKNKSAVIVAFMLDNGIDPNTRVETDDAYSPLIAAINNDDIDIVRLLIDKKIKVNFKANKTQMPLDIAETRGNRQIIDLLKAHGARNATPRRKTSPNWSERCLPNRLRLK
jgi:predicted DNA-binding WGR domain protein